MTFFGHVTFSFCVGIFMSPVVTFLLYWYVFDLAGIHLGGLGLMILAINSASTLHSRCRSKRRNGKDRTGNGGKPLDGVCVRLRSIACAIFLAGFSSTSE